MKKFVLCFLLLSTTPAFCDAVSETLQARLNAMHTMSATFDQVVNAKKREVSHSSGMMALARPGQFRWQTEKPLAQWVIADGHDFWVYDIDLEQVTVKRQDKSLGGTAALFLSGYNNSVTRDYDVTVKKSGDIDCFDLHAKSAKENFQRMKLSFDGDALIGIELFDQLGQHTNVHLSNIKTNPTLSSTLFKFKIPKGVDVVEQ